MKLAPKEIITEEVVVVAEAEIAMAVVVATVRTEDASNILFT